MEKKFKPFDKVIVRMVHNEEWQCDLYSHQDPITKHHVTVGFSEVKEDNILPYEGNEHLVGSQDEPDEEVKLFVTEKVMAYTKNENWLFATHISVFIMEELFNVRMSNGEDIKVKKVVKFSDFNPNDVEETRKHILCVKNGKIVKYKNN